MYLHGTDIFWGTAVFVQELPGMQGNSSFIFPSSPQRLVFIVQPPDSASLELEHAVLMCAVDCSVCYSINQQALLVFPPSCNLFNLPFFPPTALMAR